jgi:hypothetical protein
MRRAVTDFWTRPVWRRLSAELPVDYKNRTCFKAYTIGFLSVLAWLIRLIHRHRKLQSIPADNRIMFENRQSQCDLLWKDDARNSRTTFASYYERNEWRVIKAWLQKAVRWTFTALGSAQRAFLDWHQGCSTSPYFLN